MHRRHFLHRTALGTAGVALAPALLADPYAPLPRPALRPGRPVRVQGHVEAGGRGLPDVAVTDGRTIVTTDASGDFSLVSDDRHLFAYLCLPDGYRIPQNRTGTARFYEPIRPDARGDARVLFLLDPDPIPAERHAFLVLADPQTQDAYEMGLFHTETVPDVQQTVRDLGERPVFGVACGDIMFDDLTLYPQYEEAVGKMGVPFFQVLGNHDLDFEGRSDEASAQTFGRYFGPTYYAFDRGAVHYVVLDDVFWHGAGYIGYLDETQLHWLEQDLARIEAGRTVVVFVHIPALSTRYRRAGESRPAPSGSITNREALYRLLEPYDAHIISGHTHECEHVFEGGAHEHVVGAACGAWWSGPICYDGTPNGYAVFEADGEALRWRYKATGEPADLQLRLYPRGADPSAPDEIVANVWDWDPDWMVTWFEDGEPRGPMARRTGTDPDAETLHRGDALPLRRPWVEPVPTDHLFYAPVRPETREIRVEATDRWGRTYTAVLDAE